MTPRDLLELDVLERTDSPDIAAYVGEAIQAMIEHRAAELAWVMGVPPEMLMPTLWEMVEVG